MQQGFRERQVVRAARARRARMLRGSSIIPHVGSYSVPDLMHSAHAQTDPELWTASGPHDMRPLEMQCSTTVRSQALVRTVVWRALILLRVLSAARVIVGPMFRVCFPDKERHDEREYDAGDNCEQISLMVEEDLDANEYDIEWDPEAV